MQKWPNVLSETAFFDFWKQTKTKECIFSDIKNGRMSNAKLQILVKHIEKQKAATTPFGAQNEPQNESESDAKMDPFLNPFLDPFLAPF